MAPDKKVRINKLNLGDGDCGISEIIERLKQSDEAHTLFENPNKSWFGANVSMSDVDGEGGWQCCQFSDDFFVLIADFHCRETRFDRQRGAGMLDIHVKLEGHTCFNFGGNQSQELVAPCLSAGTHPIGQDFELEIHPKRERSVTFHFKPEYFYQNLAPQILSIPESIAQFIFNHSIRVSNYLLPLNADIINAASAILSARERFSDKLWLSYVHSRSEELICYVIETISNISHLDEESYSVQDIDTLIRARDFIADNFSENFTIIELARAVGTNQTSLKQNFKSIFGETLFEYKTRLRMQWAMQLIQQKAALSDVAEQVGYQQQASFSRAFKAYYGFSAKDCRPA
ncbi:helix-turn-helix domain-containing protein [Pseudoteredinibacter isoporae]|uniref:AraC-like DNA-binding protein n=1 Tax=Pseudoteredinibacter isoporae TaxID=570281 RepID=A0A7X0JR27_9GAMM|nr:AraC family transcriptional regulator [Pseudoteredinibacter isoporae]MBB6520229.1 AraC-like DNA-binding protein [Pseudoteredinibacter isoporae]NHO85801.1 helix-turn-helix transcriptional regulator [Pseudoteredinibacter isoporae]NIB25747.1 helix-turn-helix transcriptional regulator [Pseudoteredinibacter isoporae]